MFKSVNGCVYVGEGLRRSFATPDPFVLTNKICLNQDIPIILHTDSVKQHVWIRKGVSSGVVTRVMELTKMLSKTQSVFPGHTEDVRIVLKNVRLFERLIQSLSHAHDKILSEYQYFLMTLRL